jgi:uncharacterized protein with PIN domain
VNLRKSPVVGAVACLIVLLAAVFGIRGCQRVSRSQIPKGLTFPQYCLACGHVWRMTPKQMLKDARQDTTNNSFTRCPECGAQRGVTMSTCEKCGKPIPRVYMHEAEDGAVSTWVRTLCDECAKAAGAKSGPPSEGPPPGPEQ